jgi:hypothetical protein
MLLSDLFEDMAPSALDQVLNGANKLATLYADNLTYLVKNLYAEGMHDDMYRTTKTMVGREKGKWFADNYLSTSSRRNTPTVGLKNGLMSLSRDRKYASIQSDVLTLANLAIYASAEQRYEKDASFGQHVNQLETLPHLLYKIAPLARESKDRVITAAVRLKNAISSFYDLWERLHNDWDNTWGDAADIRKEKEQKQRSKKETQQSTNAQVSQADMIVNQVLGDLDKKVAHEIRTAISRSDNKLLALQRELGKRNIKM